MTEENPTLAANSVDTAGSKVGIKEQGVVDVIEGMVDTIPSTEETILLKQESKLPAKSTEDSSSAKEPISSTEITSPVLEEQMVIASVESSSAAEVTVPLSVEMNSPAEEITPPLEDTSSPAEKTVLTSVQTNSPVEEIVPLNVQTSSPEEQIVPSADEPNLATETASAAEEAELPVEENITTTEEIDQPREERVSSPGATILTTEGIISPVEIIQSENAESEAITTHPEKEEIEDKDTVQDNRAREISAGVKTNEAVPAGKPSEEVVPLTEEDCKVNGDGSVTEVDDDMEADEEVYSEEFQHENGSSVSPSVSPVLSYQLESPTSSDCTGRKLDITKHNYSRYNTVSYRKIRKGNTKQRIDEFESMLHIN
ncbi:ermin [Callorhinchus milii]|uniref:ermin n=1 Tax=Callorhinchus milii TaxID=7868 RepID=UPI001C3FA548|nr:ermin [Callorhinchus milii]